jgi:hypothetical protein
MAPPTQQDIGLLLLRIELMEREVKRLSEQLQGYVPARENDLKVQGIQDSVKRIEGDLSEAKRQLVELNSKLTAQEQTAQLRDNEQRASQDKLQIRVLVGILSTVGGIIVAVIIFYLTHLLR